MNGFGKFINRVQKTVDTHPHPTDIPFGFNMDIAGPLVKGIAEEMIDGIDDVMVVGGEFIQ